MMNLKKAKNVSIEIYLCMHAYYACMYLNTTLMALLLLKVFQIWEASNSKGTGKI